MHRQLLNISDLTKEDFNEILNYADILDKKLDNSLQNKNIGLIFEKNSTRTRLSFQVGIKQLDGNSIDIKLDELNFNRFESYEDTFEMMGCYLDCLIFRTTSHEKLIKASKFFKKPIVNALSDLSHPCQAISDIYTLKNQFGDINNLKIVWMGDINNVLYSLIQTVSFLDNTTIDIFTDENIFKLNKNFLEKKNIIPHFDIDEKVISAAHCIMTDVYNSMNDKEDKEPILKKFQVNENIISLLKKNAVFMHCLPANIGSEVTKNVIKGSKSIVIQQAKNRMIAQRGILKWLNI